MRTWILASAALFMLVLAFLAWPFVTLYRLGDAVHSGNVEAVLSEVDVASVRRSLIRQVIDEGTRGTPLDAQLGEAGRQIAVGVAADLVDAEAARILTPEVLRRLLAGGELPPELAKAGSVPGVRTFGLPENPLRHLKDYELRSLDRVTVTLGGEAREGDWIAVSLRLRNFRWRVRDIRLPPSVMERIRPAIRERIDLSRS